MSVLLIVVRRSLADWLPRVVRGDSAPLTVGIADDCDVPQDVYRKTKGDG